MKTCIVEETFDPSEFEEPELYESMKVFQSLDNIEKIVEKKTNIYGLKKTIKREKRKEKLKGTQSRSENFSYIEDLALLITNT